MRRPHVILSEQEVRTAVDFLLREPEFVFDIETLGGNPRTNELAWVGLGAAGRTFLIPCGHPKGWMVSPERTERAPAALHYPADDPRRLTPTGKPSMRLVEYTVPPTYSRPPPQLFPDQLCNLLSPLMFSDRPKIGHNVKYDLMSLAKYYGGGIPPGPYHDTIILQHVLDENKRNYGLKELSVEWFRPKDPKRWYPKFGKDISIRSMEQIARYLAKDVRYCWYLKQRLWAKLVREGLQSVYDLEMAVYPAIMGMEMAGFPVDISGLGDVRQELEGRIAAIEEQCFERAGDEFPMSNLGIKRWILFGHGDQQVGIRGTPLASEHLAPLNFTEKTNQPQLNQAVLAYYADRNDMARLFLDYSVYEKLRGTFVVGLSEMLTYAPNATLPTLHTSFKQHGTVTGRLSAEKPNLQQLPRGTTIRRLFVAGEDHVLIVADYDQVELRVAGYESDDPEMKRTFLAGEDVHRQAAAAMYSIALDAVTDEQRSVGKTQNFAVLYGAGEKKIAAVAGCSVTRAKQLIKGYFELFSQLEPWKARVLQAARAAGDPTSFASHPPFVAIPPYGRRRRLPELMNYQSNEEWSRYKAERQAVNALVQGFASYITKLAMVELHEKLKAYPAQMVVQVHDEIVVRVEKSYADTVLGIVTDTMSGVRLNGGPILGEIPLVVSAHIGSTWAEAKGK